jgi:hypothetical protein
MAARRRALARLLRLAGDGQGSERGRAEGRGCHQSCRRTGDCAAAPFRRDCDEVECVDGQLEPPPLRAVSAAEAKLGRAPAQGRRTQGEGEQNHTAGH